MSVDRSRLRSAIDPHRGRIAAMTALGLVAAMFASGIYKNATGQENTSVNLAPRGGAAAGAANNNLGNESGLAGGGVVFDNSGSNDWTCFVVERNAWRTALNHGLLESDEFGILNGDIVERVTKDINTLSVVAEGVEICAR